MLKCGESVTFAMAKVLGKVKKIKRAISNVPDMSHASWYNYIWVLWTEI